MSPNGPKPAAAEAATEAAAASEDEWAAAVPAAHGAIGTRPGATSGIPPKHVADDAAAAVAAAAALAAAVCCQGAMGACKYGGRCKNGASGRP